MPARASPSGFAAHYHFSISLGFTVVSLSEKAGTCLHVEYTQHPALKGLKNTFYIST